MYIYIYIYLYSIYFYRYIYIYIFIIYKFAAPWLRVALLSTAGAFPFAQEFLREREANLEKMCQLAGPDELVAGRKSLFGVPIPEVQDGPLDQKSWDKLEKKAEKIAARKAKRQDRPEGEVQQNKRAKTSHPARWVHDGGSAPGHEGRDPGCALLSNNLSDNVAGILKKQGFRMFASGPSAQKITSFMQEAWQLSARRDAGHVVAVSNLAVCEFDPAVLAGKLLGAFILEGEELRTNVFKGTVPPGIQAVSVLKKTDRTVFLHPDLAAQEPLLVQVLATATVLPGSKLGVARKEKDVQKRYKSYLENHGRRSRPWEHFRVALPDPLYGEAAAARKKFPGLYSNKRELFKFLAGPIDRDKPCPGRW